ncbi:hypothetical protein H1Z61_05200 [Bacillus aquiflavi]|uniref:Uncharacterized protein n=1 Tax=Bacillus aquiflavi TaxID=2672567 RepID=A0A6B3VUL2_9BACI|nr:hypothetical protein [Bacillus aquiflavi]MBA4536561.1 hypothetical protein [Bacillus aquiflavi]NEY80928.1 hypothetical protein [Bacillus aquiflavi]UAC49644.1 hypothetical protein K6959_07530 [Bacillus aquiflavi]
MIVDCDVANILFVNNDSSMYVEYVGEKSILGTPKIDIVYNKDQAIIKVNAIQKKWINIFPGARKRYC